MHEVNIGATIARERSAAGVTQGALAAHLGVTKAAVETVAENFADGVRCCPVSRRTSASRSTSCSRSARS